jgi:hypothetical protein
VVRAAPPLASVGNVSPVEGIVSDGKAAAAVTSKAVAESGLVRSKAWTLRADGALQGPAPAHWVLEAVWTFDWQDCTKYSAVSLVCVPYAVNTSIHEAARGATHDFPPKQNT